MAINGQTSTWFLIFTAILFNPINGHEFPFTETTIQEIQSAFAKKKLTSRQLVDLYMTQIETLNPQLRSVLEVNPDARSQAEKADDTIATKDKLNTTAGSFALVGSVVPRDATVVERLRNAGAVILGKTSLTEWYSFRSLGKVPNGWCARGGQAQAPAFLNQPVYVLIICRILTFHLEIHVGQAVDQLFRLPTNMVVVSLGSETHGSILCPSDHNSVVGFKPTVGLTSRAGVIPVLPHLNTIGPISRTVSDAVYVLDVIAGFDPRDYEATSEAAKYIPIGGYKQFLNQDGLKGKRLGVVRHPFVNSLNGSTIFIAFERHLNTLRSGELTAMLAGFKISVNDYLKELISSPEKTEEYGQATFISSEKTSGYGEKERKAFELMEKLSQDGFEKMMAEYELDAMVTPGVGAISCAGNRLAIQGLLFPADMHISACPSAKTSPCMLQLSPTWGNNFKRICIKFKPATNENKVIGNEQAYLQDTDAVYVLDAIVVFDHNDEGTREASNNSKQFWWTSLNIANVDVILNGTASGETLAFTAEFKLAFNKHTIKGLLASPGDVSIQRESSQNLVNGIDDEVTPALLKLENFSRNGFEKFMRDNKLDALVTPGFRYFYCSCNWAQSEAFEIAYAFERGTKIQKPPPSDIAKNLIASLSFHHSSRMASNSSSLSIYLLSLLLLILLIVSSAFSIKEATIEELQFAFKQNQLTSRQLVEFYLGEISRLNPVLRGVIEVNPDALYLADKADQERKAGAARSKLGLHGVPILVKDNIATKDKMNTTAGSFALLGSVVPRHAFVVTKLIQAGAIILGKASMTEWAHFRSYEQPGGWCARSGQGKQRKFSIYNSQILSIDRFSMQNPYVLSAETCGSSSGSAISVAANLAAGALGTDTAGSILCPSGLNSVVGIKPTVGLTSRDGVIPISPRQDSVGPICRTVADAVYILDAYWKILGIARNIPVSNYANESDVIKAFELHIQTLREQGAVVVDHLKLTNIDGIVDIVGSGQILALAAEFKLALNAYLKGLVTSPVRSLADVIAFYKKFAKLEKTKEYGQSLFIMAQATNGFDKDVKAALLNLTKLSRDGFEKLMKENKLDAVVTPGIDMVVVLAIGGFPGIIVPGGYDGEGKPFGIYFGGLKGSEPKLIEIAYGFEQATKIRKPPSFKP
ncbi:hypothetical protein Pint_34368 [Pistacia integerrima]|uniref:Uncharacterized protein n=1 Tax=Pistacia integerrima TaxID=434235 RepID=A0ACC0X4Q6_9ROSI|nr:hypothetical protein Pint_34368 [Pistacia integerrima]